MMRDKRLSDSLLIALIVFVCSLNYQLLAGNGRVSLEAKVDKNKIKIGDLINYSIIVTRDKDIQVEMPNLGANLGAFEIHDYEDLEPEKNNGEIVQRRNYIISTYDIGDYEIPPVTVRYSLTGDSLWKELTTESIKITVESLKPSEEGDIRDIKPPLEIERDWWRLIRFVLAGVILLLIVGLILYYFKQRKQGKPLIPKKEKPKRPPHEIALEELQKLLDEQLLRKGEVKMFYIRISDIIRHYIEQRFFLAAIEMTTFQLTNTMKESEIEPEIVDLVEDFLMQCDLVKFAKYIPSEEENQHIIDLAFKIVEDTKIVFEPETTEDEEKELVEHEEVQEEVKEHADVEDSSEAVPGEQKEVE